MTEMFGGTPHEDLLAWPPAGAVPLVEFRVDGEPKPAGSKDSGIVTRWDAQQRRRVPVLNPATGMPRTFTKDSSGAKGKSWRSDIRSAVVDVLDEAHELWDGPLVLEAVFFGERSKAHFGTGRNAGVLKDSAPRYPHASKLADGTKLTRALEDALTKAAWTDDRRVVSCLWHRRFGKPGAVVRIYALPVVFGAVVSEAQGALLAG